MAIHMKIFLSADDFEFVFHATLIQLCNCRMNLWKWYWVNAIISPFLSRSLSLSDSNICKKRVTIEFM